MSRADGPAALIELAGVTKVYGHGAGTVHALAGVDIRIERGNSRVYIPLVSMILVSIVLSLVMAIVRRLLP